MCVSMPERTKEFVRPAILFVIELSHRAQATAVSVIGRFVQVQNRAKAATAPLIVRGLQVYDTHVKHPLTPLIDAGRAKYDSVAAPLFREIDTKTKQLLFEMRLVVNSLVEQFAIQFSRSCPTILSVLDVLGERINLQLFGIGKSKLESLCLDAKGTSVLIFKLIGVVLGVIFAFILRRPLLRLSLKVGRLFLWPVRVLLSLVLAPFLFVFRLPMMLLRLCSGPAREMEATQTDEPSCQLKEEDDGDEHSCKLIEEDAGDEHSCKLIEEDKV